MKLALDGYLGECRRESDLAISTGWYCEMFARAKKLRPLKHYLIRSDRTKTAAPQSTNQMLATVRQLVGGAAVRKVGEEPSHRSRTTVRPVCGRRRGLQPPAD